MENIIAIVPYHDCWPAEFERVAAPLRQALGDLALRIDHIGSTAVPGLAAKDIIDVQVTVAALDATAISTALKPLGYTIYTGFATDHVPPGWPDDAAEWSKLYYSAPPDQRPMHLHVREEGRANQRYALLFRDYLRAASTAAGAYGKIKQTLSRLHPEDVDAYYDVKDPVCDLIIDAAQRWAVAAGYVPESPDR
jgi:GrpB-like predicted nucleotidyltransferase (UPF0157 family)